MNCSSDLKNFANSPPSSASNFKSSSLSLLVLTQALVKSKNIISGIISTHCGYNTGFDFVTILADVVSCSSLVCSSGKIQFHYREWVAWAACILRSKYFRSCMWYFFFYFYRWLGMRLIDIFLESVNHISDIYEFWIFTPFSWLFRFIKIFFFFFKAFK